MSGFLEPQFCVDLAVSSVFGNKKHFIILLQVSSIITKINTISRVFLCKLFYLHIFKLLHSYTRSAEVHFISEEINKHREPSFL